MIIGKDRIYYNEATEKLVDSNGVISNTDSHININGIWKFDAKRKQYYIQTEG